jgi:hypothetical protein
MHTIRRKIKTRYLAAIPPLLLLLVWTFIPIAPAQAHNTTHPVTISGSGNNVLTLPTVTSTPQNPSCVLLRTFAGTDAFTGVIATNSPGTVLIHDLADTCVSPLPTVPGLSIDTLNDVTVSCGSGSPTCPVGLSKTGGLVLQGQFTSIGLFTDPTGSNTQVQLTVLSGTGGLQGITGHGLAVAHGNTTGAFSTYWIELTFGNSAH